MPRGDGLIALGRRSYVFSVGAVLEGGGGAARGKGWLVGGLDVNGRGDYDD